MRPLVRKALCSLALAIALLAPAASPALASLPVDGRGSDYGADYAWYRPTRSQLSSADVSFVARYLVPRYRGSGKALSASEAATLRSYGLVILLNYEWSADSAKGGYAAGVRDAQQAEQARSEVGAPANLPIYFSVDFDPHGWTNTVVAYLNGAASVIGRARVGVYGGYLAVKAAFDAGYGYGWQTYAWSAGAWDTRAQVRQIANGAFWGGQGDRDLVVRADFGGWGGSVVLGGAQNPTAGLPTGTPTAPSGFYTVRRGDSLSLIAHNFGMSLSALEALNPSIRNPNLIYVGQLIRVSGAPVNPIPGNGVYVVRAGDTLSRIAQKYGTTVGRLMALNPAIHNANLIYVGEQIHTAGNAPNANRAAPQNMGYRVQTGDTLSRIASKYHTTVRTLLVLNPQIHNANVIYAGAYIRVP